MDAATLRLDRTELDRLLTALQAVGYGLVGPTLRDGAIVYDRISAASDLPIGWTEAQDAGRYRVERRADEACFGYVVGPHSFKQFLFPAEHRLWSARRSADGFEFDVDEQAPEKLAFIGVRACELAAIETQDKVFLGREFTDADYARRRASVLLVAVNCTQAGGTCFCVSMRTGPAARGGYDIVLTEVLDATHHYFVLSAGSDAGRDVLARVTSEPATAAERGAATAACERAAAQMGRTMHTEGLPALLREAASDSRWQDVAERCLGCANCTMVCPTCFCHSVEDVVELGGARAERWRRWDSCFNVEFSYIHGGAVRPSTSGRYRQWLTHKLGTWHDQFGASGCVGCGRCITWCPVGIDLTAEVQALRGSAGSGETS